MARMQKKKPKKKAKDFSDYRHSLHDNYWVENKRQTQFDPELVREIKSESASGGRGTLKLEDMIEADLVATEDRLMTFVEIEQFEKQYLPKSKGMTQDYKRDVMAATTYGYTGRKQEYSHGIDGYKTQTASMRGIVRIKEPKITDILKEAPEPEEWLNPEPEENLNEVKEPVYKIGTMSLNQVEELMQRCKKIGIHIEIKLKSPATGTYLRGRMQKTVDGGICRVKLYFPGIGFLTRTNNNNNRFLNAKWLVKILRSKQFYFKL